MHADPKFNFIELRMARIMCEHKHRENYRAQDVQHHRRFCARWIPMERLQQFPIEIKEQMNDLGS
jgi:hypothetical protein